eukprot:3042483-Rhodomonas_salina.3
MLASDARRVLGVHDGLLVEYDADTLAPLGVVVDKTQMQNRQVVIADNGHSLMLVQQVLPPFLLPSALSLSP